MSFFRTLCLRVFLTGFFAVVVAKADEWTSDPVGFLTNTLVANSVTLVPVNLVRDWTFAARVVEVDQQGIRFTQQIPADVLMGVGVGFAEVREGSLAGGLKLGITGIVGDRLLLEWSPQGMIQPNDLVCIRPEWTIGGLLGSSESYWLEAGSNVNQADTVGLWDPATQTSRVFYFRTGQGWVEAGKESDGSKASVPIRFPGGLIIRRRAATEGSVVIWGAVPIPLSGYYVVRPGRNVVSAPFSPANRISDFLPPLDSSCGLTSGPSAPESDTLRFTRTDGSLSPVVYLRSDRTWRAAGSDQDAGNLELTFSQCIDFHRVGPAGLLRIAGGIETAPAPAPAPRLPSDVEAAPVPPEAKIAILSLVRSEGGLIVRWAAESGAIYQVQSRPPGESQWRDIGPPVTATGENASLEFQPTGQGILRIVKP